VYCSKPRYENAGLEIIFYHEDYIYKYNTVLKADPNLGSKANFIEQHIYRKKYYKTKVKEIYSDDELKIPREYKGKIKNIEKYCIKPEIRDTVDYFRGLECRL